MDDSWIIIQELTRWFPEIGLPPVIIHFRLGFSIINQPFLDYPNYGPPRTSMAIDPKMEVLYHIRPYFVGIFPYIGLTNRPQIYGIGTSNESVPVGH